MIVICDNRDNCLDIHCVWRFHRISEFEMVDANCTTANKAVNILEIGSSSGLSKDKNNPNIKFANRKVRSWKS